MIPKRTATFISILRYAGQLDLLEWVLWWT